MRKLEAPSMDEQALVGQPEAFGDVLRRHRRAAGLTQEALAERAGVSARAIADLERGINQAPRRDTLQLLATALGLAGHERAAFEAVAQASRPSPARQSEWPDAVLPFVHGDRLTPRAANPYKALSAFEEADAPDFFGREALVARLLQRLDGEGTGARFLAIVGPSGCGKSSIVRAGLLPSLRGGALPASERWPIALITPGERPLEELEAALLRLAVNPPSTLLTQLREDDRGLVRAVKRALPQDSAVELILVIDQFEELFTQLDDDTARRQVLECLYAAATDPHSRTRIIVALRADFYDRPLRYLRLGELLRERTEVVLPMTTEELERAIRGPAARAGVALEPELVGALIGEMGDQPGALPLLQYTLTELFEQRGGRTLTLGSYRERGGIHTVVAGRAEAIYSGLGAPEQQAARQVFLRLVTLGEGAEDTRRRARVGELASLAHGGPVLEAVLEGFGRYRLLTFDRDRVTGEPTVEVAHEALLREWGRLREWLDGSRDALRLQRRLLAAAHEWENADRDPSFLATGVRLEQFEALVNAGGPGTVEITAEEQSYLEASVAQRAAERDREDVRQARELELAHQSAAAERRAATWLRYLAGALGVFLLIAGGLAAIALSQRATADTERRAALADAAQAGLQREQAQASAMRSEALRLAAEANLLLRTQTEPELTALLAIRSLRLGYSPEADSVLESADLLAYPRHRYSAHSPWPVVTAAFLSGGGDVLTASQDDTIRLWDAVGQLRSTINTGVPITAAQLSPDGKRVLIGGRHVVRLWDLVSGRELRRFAGHTGRVNAVAFSPDGRYAISGAADQTARLWDLATGRELRRFAGHGSVNGVAFSPSGAYVLTANDDTTAQLWDVATGRPIRSFVGHTAPVRAVAFSPDGRMVLTASADHTARLWDLASGRELRRFTGHTDWVLAGAFSPDGAHVLTGSSDSTARLWDARTGAQLCTLAGHTAPVLSVAFAPDGRTALTGSTDYTAASWDMASCVGISQTLRHPAGADSIAISSDGRYLLAGLTDGTARLWDLRARRPIRDVTGLTGDVWAVVFGPTGTAMLTGAGQDNTALLWNLATGRQLRAFAGHTDAVIATAISRDGRYALTGSLDGTARLWDLSTGRELRRLAGHTGPVPDVAFLPDGRTLVTGGADGTVRLWDATSGRELRRLIGHKGHVNGLALSQNGDYVLTANEDATATLWDVATGRRVRTFTGHTDEVGGAAFSPDRRTALTGSLDGTARLWDLESGRELRRFTASGPVSAVAFSPDGAYVITAAADGTVRFWSIDYHRDIHTLCGRLTRDLSAAERAQYNIQDTQPTCLS